MQNCTHTCKKKILIWCKYYYYNNTYLHQIIAKFRVVTHINLFVLQNSDLHNVDIYNPYYL